MRRKNFFILIMMVLGIGMTIRALFGGNSDIKDIPQDESTGFPESLINTGETLNSGNIQIDTGDTTQTKNYAEIKVMMPKYFYNSGRKKFAEDLYHDNKVYIKFILIDDLNSYRQQLYDTGFSAADIFLFPYDRSSKVPTYGFVINDIQSYFDQLLSPILGNKEVTFLPFSADPMIMYATSGFSSTNTFHEISEFSFNRQPTRALAFPIFFGINTEDFDKKGFSREYQDIVRYALMHYFQVNHDSHDLQIWIDTNVLQTYNIQNLQMISNIITTPECKYFPSICFQLFNFVGIRFGFLSDADIVNQYLQNKKTTFSAIQKRGLPFSHLESPVRIRGRGVSPKIDSQETNNGVYLFIKKYMNEHSQYGLRNSTFPVFKTGEGNGLLDNSYIGLRGYIMQEGGDYLDTLRRVNSFWDLIEYKITAKEYLQ